ncbi:MAG: hypothetical protein AVDCRST_MAG10-2316, partial [uncultured Acidimicrobiales bacterium]
DPAHRPGNGQDAHLRGRPHPPLRGVSALGYRADARPRPEVPPLGVRPPAGGSGGGRPRPGHTRRPDADDHTAAAPGGRRAGGGHHDPQDRPGRHRRRGRGGRGAEEGNRPLSRHQAAGRERERSPGRPPDHLRPPVQPARRTGGGRRDHLRHHQGRDLPVHRVGEEGRHAGDGGGSRPHPRQPTDPHHLPSQVQRRAAADRRGPAGRATRRRPGGAGGHHPERHPAPHQRAGRRTGTGGAVRRRRRQPPGHRLGHPGRQRVAGRLGHRPLDRPPLDRLHRRRPDLLRHAVRLLRERRPPTSSQRV